MLATRRRAYYYGHDGLGWRLIIAIPEILREKLGPEGARALADLLNEASVRTRGDVIEIAASRFERRLAEELAQLRAEFRADLSAEIGGLRAELHSEIGGLREELRSEFHSEIGELRSEIAALREDSGRLRVDMAALESRVIRWMFIFWIGQLGAMLGIFFVFFRALA